MMSTNYAPDAEQKAQSSQIQTARPVHVHLPLRLCCHTATQRFDISQIVKVYGYRDARRKDKPLPEAPSSDRPFSPFPASTLDPP
jgi:hypothetical protein